MLVERITDESEGVQAWEQYVARHADATVYHDLAWRNIFQAGFGYPSWYLLAREREGAPPAGVLPLFLVRTPFSRRLVAVPFRDRGGVLWDTGKAFAALLAEAREIAVSTGATSIRLKSVVPYPEPDASKLGFTERRYWVRSVVDLGEMTHERLWREIGDKNRNMVRQAQRQGLQCEPLPPTRENLREWHRLHVLTQKRLGVPPFPAVFFAAMAEYLGSGLELFGARRGETLHATTILLMHRNMALYAYSASDSAGQHWRANDLMLFEAMRRLIAKGIGMFDLGSDSPHQKSLLFFKRKWLAQQAAIPHYGFGSSPVMDSSNARYIVARKVFSLLPAPVLAPLGAAITRYFG